MQRATSTPDLIELHDPEPQAAWRDHRSSGMDQLVSSSYLCMVLEACARVGLLQRLADGTTDPDELFQGIDRALATNILQYLQVQGVVDIDGETYRLTERGQLLCNDISLALLGFYVQAYGPVIQQTARLLSGQSTYGRDVTRDTAALGRHSATMFHTFHTPTVLHAMADMGATCILDLGCGAGRLLIDACQRDSRLNGVGLDIAGDAIELAHGLAKQANLDDRLEFVVANAFDPEHWPSACAKADALVAVGVMHEHFREGEDRVIELLNRFAGLLRGGMKGFLLGEPELYYDDKENDSDFFLAHILTAQGFPRRRELWLELFARSDLRCRRMITRPDAGQRLVFFDLVAA